MSSSKTNLCINCQKALKGEYCHHCGEKVISENDFTIRNIFAQAIDIFTHIDSKLFKSFRWLLFKPGLLSVSYVKGLRKPFMKPFQIFVLCNILFFILLSNVDVFRKPSQWWFNSKAEMGFNIQEIVNHKTVEKNVSIDELAMQYDNTSNSFAKAFVILFIPFIGIIFALLQFKKKMKFGKHIIFAIHMFSFILFITILWTKLLTIFPYQLSNKFYVLPILIILIIYFILAIRRFYNNSWGLSILNTIVALSFIFIIMELYRSAISLIVLNNL